MLVLCREYMGIGGVTVPQAELDVAGSIRCSLSLVAGNIDVVERLLTHTAAIAGKQPLVTDDSLEIRHVRLLQGALDGKQSLLTDWPAPASVCVWAPSCARCLATAAFR